MKTTSYETLVKLTVAGWVAFGRINFTLCAADSKKRPKVVLPMPGIPTGRKIRVWCIAESDSFTNAYFNRFSINVISLVSVSVRCALLLGFENDPLSFESNLLSLLSIISCCSALSSS